MTSALSLRLARAAFDHAKKYCLERTTVRKRIGSFQLVQQ